jgi:hypothetical protein
VTQLPVPGEFGLVDYASSSVPAEYHCGKCGARGVKLWRLYQTFLNRQSLLCAECACIEQNQVCNGAKMYSIRELDAGRVAVSIKYILGGWEESGDQIGGRVPAVPTAGGGYVLGLLRGSRCWSNVVEEASPSCRNPRGDSMTAPGTLLLRGPRQSCAVPVLALLAKRASARGREVGLP